MSTLCPDCSAPIDGLSACASCGLRLTGPLAQRLWVVDQELGALRTERVSLIARLHEQGEAPAPAAVWAPQPVRPRESSPQQVQNTLLSLGALLLAGAGLVFAAVTYQHLGVVGRALVLIALTAAAVGTSELLRRKSLGSSAESVGVVALVLGVVDAWAARRAGWGADVDPSTYAAVASGVLALLAGTWAAVSPLRANRVAAVVLAQGPLVLALDAVDAGPARIALALAVLVAADAAVATSPLPRECRATATGFGALWTAVSIAASVVAVLDRDRSGVAGLVVLAVVAAGIAWQRSGVERTAFAATVTPLLATAAWGFSRTDLTTAQQPLVLVAIALVGLQVTALLRSDREGPVLGALAVGAAALVTAAQATFQAVLGPFTWLSEAWSFQGSAARDAVAVHTHWSGTVVTVVVLACGAGIALSAGLLLDRLRDAVVPAGVLVGLAAVALPLGLATSFTVALAVLLALGGALCLVAVLRLPVLTGVGLAVVGIATAWSLATQDATLAVVPLAALLCAALAVRYPGALTGTALTLGTGELTAYGVTRELSVDQVGALVLIGTAAAVALSFLLPRLHRLGAEGAAVLLALVSLGLTSVDAGWLSWAFGLNGLLALAVATRTDRRLVGYAGALLLSASSWVRLADAHVTAPEPYVLPLAVMALVLGWFRREHGSFQAYGPGLTLALVPSLLASFDDPTPFRGLLVLMGGAAVVLVGGQQKLRAPLAIGGGVVVVEALHLLAPYAAALPRWVVLAVAGGLLVGVGATYEQRLRDVHRARERFDSFA